MSSPGLFGLAAISGKRVDELLVANDSLLRRVEDIRARRAAAKMRDIDPTLPDISRTHNLFVDAQYKPMVKMAFEYVKFQSNTGQGVLGNQVTFQVQHAGDFFSDICGHYALSGFSANAQALPARSVGSSSAPAVFPTDGKDANGNTLAGAFYQLVDSDGTQYTTGNYQNHVYMCDYTGERLQENTRFDISTSPLDAYDDITAAFERKFHVSQDKMAGYCRGVGQEVPLTGYDTLSTSTFSDDDSSNTPSAVVPASRKMRKQVKILNGNQTPQTSFGVTHIWNKHHFNFANDFALAFPSVCVPSTQRVLTVTLAAQNKLAFEYPNLHLRTISDNGANRVVTHSPIFTKAGISTIAVNQMEIYVNNIFIEPEIHDIYIQRVGFSLIRVFRQHKQTISQANVDIHLSQLKWPTEYIMMGFRPTWNTNANNNDQGRDWHMMCKMFNGSMNHSEEYSVQTAGGANAAAGTFKLTRPVAGKYAHPVRVASNLTLSSFGNTLYDNFDTSFFNHHMPLQFGKHTIVTPEDPGALLICYATHPGEMHGPSGYLNITRAREFYARVASDYIGSNSPVELIAIGKALNFMLINNGSAILRFNT